MSTHNTHAWIGIHPRCGKVQHICVDMAEHPEDVAEALREMAMDSLKVSRVTIEEARKSETCECYSGLPPVEPSAEKELTDREFHNGGRAVCNCKWNGGHEPTCAVVKANANRSTTVREPAHMCPMIDAIIARVQDIQEFPSNTGALLETLIPSEKGKGMLLELRSEIMRLRDYAHGKDRELSEAKHDCEARADHIIHIESLRSKQGDELDEVREIASSLALAHQTWCAAFPMEVSSEDDKVRAAYSKYCNSGTVSPSVEVGGEEKPITSTAECDSHVCHMEDLWLTSLSASGLLDTYSVGETAEETVGHICSVIAQRQEDLKAERDSARAQVEELRREQQASAKAGFAIGEAWAHARNELSSLRTSAEELAKFKEWMDAKFPQYFATFRASQGEEKGGRE